MSWAIMCELYCLQLVRTGSLHAFTEFSFSTVSKPGFMEQEYCYFLCEVSFHHITMKHRNVYS